MSRDVHLSGEGHLSGAAVDLKWWSGMGVVEGGPALRVVSLGRGQSATVALTAAAGELLPQLAAVEDDRGLVVRADRACLVAGSRRRGGAAPGTVTEEAYSRSRNSSTRRISRAVASAS